MPILETCWEALTTRPGEVAVVEGGEVGQHTGDAMTCGEVCSSTMGCKSFAACPAFGNKCWLKDREVRKGDPHVLVGGECQTYLRVDCAAASPASPGQSLTSAAPTPAPAPTQQMPILETCWEALTTRPGEVAVVEGGEVGQHTGDAMTCGEVCSSTMGCKSFAACPAFGNKCWLKDREVRKGDPHVLVGGECQTYLRVDCAAASPGTVQPTSRMVNECWGTLTSMPGDVATEEGLEIGQASGDAAICAAACDANEQCHSFARCGATCWLKDRAVQRGDPHVHVGAGCQTFIRMPCSDIQASAVRIPSPQTQPSLPSLVEKGTVREHIMWASDHQVVRMARRGSEAKWGRESKITLHF